MLPPERSVRLVKTRVDYPFDLRLGRKRLVSGAVIGLDRGGRRRIKQSINLQEREYASQYFLK